MHQPPFDGLDASYQNQFTVAFDEIGSPYVFNYTTNLTNDMNTGSVVVQLEDVPNQPLTFADRPGEPLVEDAIIAHQQVKFTRTGDPNQLAELRNGDDRDRQLRSHAVHRFQRVFHQGVREQWRDSGREPLDAGLDVRPQLVCCQHENDPIAAQSPH